MKFRSILALLLLIVSATAMLAQEQKSGRRTVIVKDGKVITDDVSGDLDFTRFIDADLLGKRAYLGVTLTDLTPELREHFGAAKTAGVLVGAVENDGPADKTGIRVGDIIVGVDGKDVASAADLRRALKDKKEGDSVRVEVLRGRARQTFVATVAEREPQTRMFRLADGEIPGLPEFRASRMTALPNCLELQSKLRELETKMKDLEKRLQK